MNLIKDGCSLILGLFFFIVWFLIHWQSAAVVLLIILAWAFIPVAIDEIGNSESKKYKPKQKPSQPKLKSVPKFNQYYPSEDIMSETQLAFYKHWKTMWNTRQPLNIDGQLSYVFCYAYGIINSRDNSKIIRELSDLRERVTVTKKSSRNTLEAG